MNRTVFPWATAGAKLWVEAWVKLPTLSGVIAAPNKPGTVAQLGLEYYAADTVSGKRFAGGGAIWDSRPFGYQCGSEFVASDTYTPFASTPIMPGTKYVSEFALKLMNFFASTMVNFVLKMMKFGKPLRRQGVTTTAMWRRGRATSAANCIINANFILNFRLKMQREWRIAPEK